MIAWFPGQGSQAVGMGKDLLENFVLAQQIFEEASDSIGVNLRKLCLDAPESELALTTNTQPCLLTVSTACFRIAQAETGFQPSLAAGHSLGEYSALVAIGALPFASAVRWVRARGEYMQEAVPVGQGGMSAVLGPDEHEVARLCTQATEEAQRLRQAGENADITIDPLVEPANLNAPGQTVIAGSTDALAVAERLSKTEEFKGFKIMRLPVSAPFHSKLMKHARERLTELFASASPAERPKAFRIPYIPNFTARPNLEPGIVFELLSGQVDHPVLWTQTVENSPGTVAVEFGPGKVLAGLAKRICKRSGRSLETVSMGTAADLKTLETLCKGAPLS